MTVVYTYTYTYTHMCVAYAFVEGLSDVGLQGIYHLGPL